MAGGVHERGELAAFQDGEERLVYAQYRSDPDARLYYLEQGTARNPAVRALAKGELACPISGCSDARLHVVNRSEHQGYRDGFSHRRGAGGHGRETLFHEQAKLLIQAWAAETNPNVVAVVEQSTADRSRRADVMLTWPDGARLAVEVQYAPLSVSEWSRRNRSYIDQGITPVWLFGHHGAHQYALTRDGKPRATLSLLHREVLGARCRLLWINPITQQVATPWTTRRPAAAPEPFRVACRLTTQNARLSLDRLYDCTLDHAVGITTPTHLKVAESQAAYDEFLLDQAEQAARDAEERARQERRAERRAQRDQAIESGIARRRAEREAAWPESALYHAVRDQFGGRIPTELVSPDPDDGIFNVVTEWWQCALYLAVFKGQPAGTTVTYRDCCAGLVRHGIRPLRPKWRAKRAILEYLQTLHHFGLITFSHTRRNDTPLATVLRGIDEQIEDLNERRDRAHAEMAAREAAGLPPKDLRCIVCYEPLDPCFKPSMQHPGC